MSTTPVNTLGSTLDPFGPDPIKPATPTIEIPKVGQPLAQHPSYVGLCNVWKFLRWAYRGGFNYKNQNDAAGEPVFVPHEREQQGGTTTEPGLKRRKRLSVYKNYVRPIVDRFNDFVFREAGIVRDTTTGGGWIEWTADVDNLGTPIAKFMRSQMRHAQVLGRQFIVARTTRTSEAGELTAAQAEAAGFRLWLERVFPVDVLDWRRSRGSIREALIQYDDGTAVLYRMDDFVELTIGEAGTVTVVGQPTPHNFGRLPVIEVAPFDETKSQVEDIAELNKQLLNLDSLLRSELYANHFTQFVMTGVDASQVQKAELGTFNLLCIPSPNANMSAMGSDTSQAAGIREAIRDDVREIYKLAGLVSGDAEETGAAESGVALAWKFHEVESKLGAIADEAERVETLIGELWTAGVGSNTSPKAPDYPEKFDVPDLAAEIDRSLSILESPKIPPTAKVEEMNRLRDTLYPELDAAKRDEIEKEAVELYNTQADAAAGLAGQAALLNDDDDDGDGDAGE